MRKAFSAVILTMLLAASASPVAAITYGQPTGDKAYTNVGSMVAKIDGEYFQVCSGSLIKHGVFLTAAHCVVGIPADWGLYVSFAPDLASTSDFIPVTGDPIAHPRFGKDMGNLYDIGALLFDPAATRGKIDLAEVAPVGYLADMSKRQLRTAKFTAVGYGTIRESRKRGWQGILDNTERRFAHQTYQSLQKAWLTLSMNQATGNGGTCYGDSGGPHFHDGVIVSLTVTGDTMCKATDKTYRLDRRWAHDFLEAHGLLP